MADSGYFPWSSDDSAVDTVTWGSRLYTTDWKSQVTWLPELTNSVSDYRPSSLTRVPDMQTCTHLLCCQTQEWKPLKHRLWLGRHESRPTDSSCTSQCHHLGWKLTVLAKGGMTGRNNRTNVESSFWQWLTRPMQADCLTLGASCRGATALTEKQTCTNSETILTKPLVRGVLNQIQGLRVVALEVAHQVRRRTGCQGVFQMSRSLCQ